MPVSSTAKQLYTVLGDRFGFFEMSRDSEVGFGMRVRTNGKTFGAVVLYFICYQLW